VGPGDELSSLRAIGCPVKTTAHAATRNRAARSASCRPHPTGGAPPFADLTWDAPDFNLKIHGERKLFHYGFRTHSKSI
jgi:hypothetical protein